MAQGDRVVIRQANVRRRRTQEAERIIEVEPRQAGNSHSARRQPQQQQRSGHGGSHVTEERYVRRVVIEEVRERPLPPSKPPHLIRNPAVAKVFSYEKKTGQPAVYEEPQPLKIPKVLGSGKDMTVIKGRSGQLYLRRAKTRHGKPPVLVPPPESSTSSEDT